MSFEANLARYAELIVAHGLNVQPGQIVNISTEHYHRDIALMVAEKAYDRGAKYVQIEYIDPRLHKLRIEKSSEADLSFVPEGIEPRYRQLVENTGANLKILGQEEPDLLGSLDPKRMNTVDLHRRKAMQYFFEEGIGKSKVQWTVVAAATPGWGKRLYPDLSDDDAEMRLWDEIFRICRADKENCLELWKEHNERLRTRAQLLTDMKIETLHFVGPGTDFRVKLSPKAKFKGGTDRSPRDVEFEPNLPTEEVFSTPDWRGTEGHVKATRPFLINGKLIKDLRMEFRDGELVDYAASEGIDHFREYIASDEGAKRLGEVALVGTDSPIFQSGQVYEEILFDENAACHVAVGFAYKFCLEGGDTMDKAALEEIGCNDSNVHTDMMISSEEVDVRAISYAGEEQLLIEKGQWRI